MNQTYVTALRRLAVRMLVIALGFIPVLVAITVYGAMGAVAGVLGAIGGAVHLVHAGVSKVTKSLAQSESRAG